MARTSTLARFETSGEILSEETLALLAARTCKLDGAEMDEGEFAAAWELLSDRWQTIRSEVAGYDTTRLRERWILPLLELMDHEPRYIGSRHTVYAENRTIPLTHEAGGVKLWLLGYGESCDEKVAAAKRKASPHELFQEYLDLSPDDWGILCSGRTIRLLHDYHKTLTRNYVEADLESIFDALDVDAFRAVWRVFRAASFRAAAKGVRPIEKLRDQSRKEGTEIGKELRKQVLEAIRTLGNGFLEADRSGELRQALQSDPVTPPLFYGALLRIVYRLLFLLFIENKPGWTPAGDPVWASSYSVSRLREQAEEQTNARVEGGDAWEGLKVVFGIIRDGCDRFGILPYGGELFNDDRLWLLGDAALQNGALLRALHLLTVFERNKQPYRVNFRALQIDALGSVYEGLLDVSPVLGDDGTFGFAPGTDRKLTGSYYTPPELVAELIKSALLPVIDDRLDGVESKEEREAALLGIRVVDPACGSGAFLIQAVDALADRLCAIRLGGEEPSDLDIREARRDVVARCIHGVDLNPMAVELCKFTLWLHVAHPKFPLSYLEPLIKCGNSLVGVPLTKQVAAARERTDAERQALLDIGERVKAAKLRYIGWPESIPDQAFEPVAGDDKALARATKKRNKEQLEGQLSLEAGELKETQEDLARAYEEVLAAADDSAEAIRRKDERYREYLRSEEYRQAKRRADLWCAAFYWPMADPQATVPTQEWLVRVGRDPDALPADMAEEFLRIVERVKPFHWELEFPGVFVRGGFDCVLGNPPWETLQLGEQEFFASRSPEIAMLSGETRKRAIRELPGTNPALHGDFERELHLSAANTKFLREAPRYRLTATGKLNTYALFAELGRDLLNVGGRAGAIVPTGIATDDTTKGFFGDLTRTRSLVLFLGLDNEKMVFPGIDHRNKFGLLCMSGSEPESKSPTLAFACSKVEWASDPARQFSLSAEDFGLLNPNTLTCPVFRTRADAELTKSLYRRTPVLVNERDGRSPWGVAFRQGTFNMTTDSGLFHGTTTTDEDRLPLYEAKMLYHYDHRYATFLGATPANLNEGSLPRPTPEEKSDPRFGVLPRYWVSRADAGERLGTREVTCLMAFRDVTSAVVERTAIFSLLPFAGVGHKAPLVFTSGDFDRRCNACLLANLNGIVFDYITRQKIGGSSLSYFILKQLPVLPPPAYTADDLTFIVPRVLELVFTAWDIKPFAEDMGYDGAPFVWDEDRRADLRAELDAYYARLYGLNRKQLRYILDPHGLSDRELEEILDPWEEPTCAGPHLLPDQPTEDFPGETFRVLKSNEERKYGEYRTRRLVLEAWARLEAELGPAEVVNYREMVEGRPSPLQGPTLCPSGMHPPLRQGERGAAAGRGRAGTASAAAAARAPKAASRETSPKPGQLELIEAEGAAGRAGPPPPQPVGPKPQAAPTVSGAQGRPVLVNGKPAILLAREGVDDKEQFTVVLAGEKEPRRFQSPPATVEEMR